MLKDWLNDDNNTDIIQKKLADLQKNQAQFTSSDTTLRDKLYENISRNIMQEDEMVRHISGGNKRNYFWRMVAVAAGVLIICSLFFFNQSLQKEAVPGAVASAEEFYSDKQTALLTLSNGDRIALGKNDTIRQGTVEIDLKDGFAKYKTNNTSGDVGYNTLTTPAGSTYKVVLSDGTFVWLNAASSLTYPTVFVDGAREVSLMGEAYFEVSSDISRPFFVQSPYGKVKVTGTAFNVNAYVNEPKHEVTLVNGKVDFITPVGHCSLIPGQKVVSEKGSRPMVKQANMDNVLAWMDNRFRFEEASIQEIMRQLDRWYGLKIMYEGVPTKETFTGSLQRSEHPAPLLSAMELSGKIAFQVTKDTIKVITPQK